MKLKIYVSSYKFHEFIKSTNSNLSRHKSIKPFAFEIICTPHLLHLFTQTRMQKKKPSTVKQKKNYLSNGVNNTLKNNNVIMLALQLQNVIT